jgi:hypothetical protein
MYGNNETNVEFDVATEQFKKGTTTGARIDAWTETTDMNNSLWDQGTATSGSYVYTAGGRTSRIKPRIMDSVTTVQSTNSGSFVMNMPTTRPAGDLYVAMMCHDGTGAITGPGGGWVEYADVQQYAAYYWVGTGSPSATYTFTGGNEQWAGTILRIKDFDITSPVIATANSGSNVTPTYPAVTATQEGTLMLSGAGVDEDNVESSGYSPSGFTDLTSVHSDGFATNTGCGFFSSEYYNPPRSGVSTGVGTLATAASDTYGSSSISIRGVAVTNALRSSVQWAHFNNTTGALDSPAPGSNGTACSGWCNNSAYDLPISSPSATNGAGLVATAMVAYNGYLYVMGGNDGTYIKSTVYVAKLGANGEPQLWHPTDANQANWVYWYKDSGLSGATAKQYLSAYAYNGKMYVLGGDTDASNNTTGATTAVQIADILPNGTLGSWSSGQALTSARYAATVQVYNGYLYILGGNTGSATINTVQYSRLNSDGTMNSWLSAAADGTGTGFTTARASRGGTMSGVWGGYIYIAGGCAVLNASGYCTSTLDDVQLASINADGTLDAWNTMAGIKNKRFGDSFIAWQDSLYRFGGCEFQDPSTGECYATHKTVQYGSINQDGDASTVSISQPFGSGNCVDPDAYNCDLPAGAGQMLSVSVILNGYLYNIGGCTTAACGTMSGNTVYAAIDSNGRLKNPPSCPGTLTGAWCSDSTNAVPGGVGAAGVTVFGGTIYLVGGQNGSAGKNTIYRNTVSADGSLAGAWTNTAFTTAGLSAYGTNGLSFTYVYSRANPSSAGSNPGNLYIFGGCDTPASGAGCTGGNTYADAVYKCNIQTSGAIAGCTTTGQMALTQVPGSTTTGIGIHAGTVYANYIYIIGGFTDGVADLDTVRYAKFDNSNNVVAVSGSTWITSSITMEHGRRRGAAFGYNGYIYAVGGYDSGSTQILDTIEFVKVNVSDGSLISTNPTDSAKFAQSAVTFNQRWGLGMAVSNSYAYIIGGCKVGASPTCTTLDSTVQTFQLYNNDSGAPGNYTTSGSLYSTDRIGAGAAVLNGYLYIAGGCTSTTDCGTTTSDVQKATIDANGTVSGWTTTGITALPAARAYGQLEVAGNDLYYIGGETGGTAQSTVYYATMGANGAISAWTATSGALGDTAGQAAVALTKFSSAVWNNRIYVTGGYTGSARTTDVYVSPQLTSGGNIAADAWTGGSSGDFNVAREGHTAIAYANNLYILGGYDGTNYLGDVQFAKLDSSNGSISGSWTYTTNLPFGLRQADGFASNGYMYLFGGRTSTNDCTSRTLIAPISANTSITSGNNPTGIGEWYQTNRNFDGGRYGVAAVNYQGKAYVLGGGCQGIVMQDDFDATIDASQWSYTTGMTAGTTCQSTSSSNVLYMTDGTNTNYAATKDVDVSSGGTVFFKFYAPIADTAGCFRREQNFLSVTDNVILQYSTNSGASWAGTAMATYTYNTDYSPLTSMAVSIPAGAQTASTRFRWVMPGGAANDSFSLEDVYIIATGVTTISYPPDRVAQTPLLSQPQTAIYSRLVDAGNDAFPKKFLMNGIDNSIGARWQMAYRSMNDPTNTGNPCGGSVMTGYGALTNFGDVTLGTPGTYTMKNGAGTDIGCGRYFFMTINIDASQTYGYPDDISRGPTLDNLTLFYNSNPGKRLIHGKAFTEGIQQPLDTQP